MYLEQRNEENEDSVFPPDLEEYIEQEKARNNRIVASTEACSKYAASYSLNATAFFLARLLLFLGGGMNLMVATGLCFTIASIPAALEMQHLSVNYEEGNWMLTGAEKTITVTCNLISATGITAIAVKDYLYHEYTSEQTIEGIRRDIDKIESHNFWGDPWSWGLQLVILLVIGLKVLILTKKS